MSNAVNSGSGSVGAACRSLGGWACAVVLLALAGCTEVAPGEAAGGGERREPGEQFRDCSGCPEVVVVPAGSFQMGSPADEEGRDSDETRRRVTIREPFAVGVREVTFAEWDACVSAGGCGRYRPVDGGWGRGRQPVINVSWDDAQAYVAWLARRTGADYRLLTEAEWEYAARARTTTPFHTGVTITTDHANYDGGRPVAAGSLARNAFGLYDVHGNVAEMVADCYDGSGSGCNRRVVRGGSWGSPPRLVRSAYRSWCAPTLRSPHNGFRVAREL